MQCPNSTVTDDADGEENEKPAPASGTKSRPVLEKIRDVFTVSKTFLCENVIKGMVEEATRGLAGEDSTLQMLPTFVTGLPTGEEKGVWVVCRCGSGHVRVSLAI